MTRDPQPEGGSFLNKMCFFNKTFSGTDSLTHRMGLESRQKVVILNYPNKLTDNMQTELKRISYICPNMIQRKITHM